MLDPSVVFSVVPVHFPNFPGVYFPGEPIAARAILERFDDADTIDDLKDHVSTEGFPLKVKMVDEGSAPMPRADTQAPSEEEVRLGEQPPPDAPMPADAVVPADTAAADTVEKVEEKAADEKAGG